MKKSATVTFLILAVLTMVCIPPLKAQTSTQNLITINADGTITPSTALILQEGDVYTLTGDVTGSISILKSNIIFNGNACSLIAIGDLRHGREGLTVGLNAYSTPPTLTGATNVTVKNLKVNGGIFGISLVNTVNSTCHQ